MPAAQFRDGHTVFLCRVAGVAVDSGRVLLHRSEHDDFWGLPGGRLEVGETSHQALRREMLEEVGTEVRVGGLLWVVENFFDHVPLDAPHPGSGEIAHHELGLYLEMQLPPHLTDTTSFSGTELAGTPHEFALEYRWIEQSEVSRFDVRPAALTRLLSGPIPDPVSTVVDLG